MAYLQSNASALTQPHPTPQHYTPSPSSRPMLTQPSPATPTTVTVPSVGVVSRGKTKREGYDRLTRSLLSGFPNEVDFAFNAFTVKSFKSPSTFSAAEVSHHPLPFPLLSTNFSPSSPP